MSIEVINQLRALRDSIAESLKKDPRYLTISALDRSITEIADVLKSADAGPPPSTPFASGEAFQTRQ